MNTQKKSATKKTDVKKTIKKTIKSSAKKTGKSVEAIKEIIEIKEASIIESRIDKMIRLAKELQTDKIDHGYLPHYDKYLPENPTRILEIGVLKGASVKMWKELFPEADIHCLDLFEEFDPRRELTNLGITCWKGSQSDYGLLYSIPGQFDVIIDDASHIADNTVITFKHGIENLLRSGGLFFVEDLHCHTEEYYWGSVKSFEDTLLYAFHNWTKEKGLPLSMFFDTNQKAVYDRLIDDVVLIDNKLAIVKRK